MFTLAILAFFTMTGGGIYAVKLYFDSQDTKVQEVRYEQKIPEVDFNAIQKHLESEAMEEKKKQQEVEKVRIYIKNIILNGSSGHGYPMGEMPPMKAQSADAEAIAEYIADGMQGGQPAAFALCSSCHGADGQGNNGMSPSLLELPVYHHLREKVSNTVLTPKQEEPVQLPKQEKSDFEKAIDTLAATINIYASTVGQDGVSKEILQNFITGEISNYTIEQRSAYLAQLIDLTQKLIAYGKTFEQNKKASLQNDITAISWIKVIELFSSQFYQMLQEESQKAKDARDRYNKLLSEKQYKAVEAQMELLVVLESIGGALVAFILLTMMLVLIRIEKNTRNCGESKDEEK
ncbi:MAG: hypothetical protein IE885_02135 [Campylobacterales bacterium]|nr:hypothetical protein [Campylobacterales bacterium]